MSRASEPAPTVVPDFEMIKRRFQALHAQRLARARGELRARQREFLDVLPLLLHVNHPGLPGFISSETPCGIPDYTPSEASLNAASQLARSFRYKARSVRGPQLRALYLMGSAGSIAHADDSDLDLWVCHASDLELGAIAALRAKCDALEAWATKLGLEVHLFLVDPERFSKGEHGRVTTESSGSAQHYLLLDEFYRTGLLLAGYFPIWWLVPPESEHEYDAYVAHLRRHRFLGTEKHLDFGGVSAAPVEEFFGAALWLVYKGVESPYKSILKTLLMEAYALESPPSGFLSERLKRAIHAGEKNLGRLDPYVLMYEKIESYLQGRGEHERLTLARRCLYFKVNEPLSRNRTPAPGSRAAQMRELVEQWGWTQGDLVMLDTRATWRVERVVRERRALVEELTRSYRLLSDFAREQSTSSAITQADLTVLGRKIYAAFERKAGKVEIVSKGMDADLTESHVTLLATRGAQGLAWTLQRVSQAGDAPEPLKRAHGLIELLTWGHFNGVLGERTLVALQGDVGELTPMEVRGILGKLRATFPDSPPEMDAFRRPAALRGAELFVNVGVDPFLMPGSLGIHLVSGHGDTLQYGLDRTNMALSVDLVMRTTWGEVLTSHYLGAQGLMDCLRDYLAWHPPGQGHLPVAPSVVSYSSPGAGSVSSRIEALFEGIIGCLYSDAQARYLVGIDRRYYIVRLVEGRLSAQCAEDEAMLCRQLAEARLRYSRLVVDPGTLVDGVLPALLERHRPEQVLIALDVQPEGVDVYVLDELGALARQRLQPYDAASLARQYDRFLESVSTRLSVGAQIPRARPSRSFFNVVRNRRGKVELQSLRPAESGRGFINLQVIAEEDSAGSSAFTLYCDSREFSSLEFGTEVFREVAAHIMARRVSGEDYPIYIVDLDLPPTLLGEGEALHTARYVEYKIRIEGHLAAAMHRLATGEGARK